MLPEFIKCVQHVFFLVISTYLTYCSCCH